MLGRYFCFPFCNIEICFSVNVTTWLLVVIMEIGNCVFIKLEVKNRKYPSHYLLNINHLVVLEIEFLCKFSTYNKELNKIFREGLN